MSFAEENGYTPSTVVDLMDLVREGINDVFETEYETDTFLGTNFYKYFYALVQRLQENEVKTSEIVLKLQQYFDTTNEMIVRPNTTAPGLVDYLAAAGYQVSVKKPEDADAGKLYVCVNLDDGDSGYAADKLEVCTLLSQSVVAGVITQGTEVESILLSNDQSFDFKFALPTIQAAKLKLTLVQSDNNQFAVLSTTDIKALLLTNLAARYKLGQNFEPGRYFSIVDAPWAESVLLEWSIDGGSNYFSTVHDLDFDDLWTFQASDITIVES